ncbi:MAG: hypothetical protein AB8B72_13310 [Crocinitomicaceae bacterium]
MKIITLFIGIAILASCGNSKNSTTNNEATNTEKEATPQAKQAILSQDIAKFKDSESYSILDVNLQGNVLQLDISYSGGCEEHNFELVGSAFIMKSSPPKRIIKLYHHKNEDNCRELIFETLYFDISKLAYHSGEIILQIEQFKQKAISYTKK